MHHRLLLILSVLFISSAAMAQNVMTPADPCYKYDPTAPAGSPTNPNIPPLNTMAKWVHDPTQNAAGRASTGANPDTIGSHGFDQSTYKCYIWNSTAFRVRFPNNYNPANKYPIVVFFNGAGEAANLTKSNNANPGGNAIDREDQDQLYWGAQLFEQRMNAGEWNGFLLFPQSLSISTEWDTTNTIPPVVNILDTLIKYNGVDQDRVIAMGLSAGGMGAVKFADYRPMKVATVVTSCPEQAIGQIAASSADISRILQIPFWMGLGGTDTDPQAPTGFSFRDAMANAGGNFYVDYYSTQGHVMWPIQWNKVNNRDSLILSSYWNTASKAQPLVYFQNTKFCAGQPISAKMELTPGFAAYEWQKDGTSISGATTYSYTATQAGTYQVHFKRAIDSPWSAWTPNPVVISTKACAPTDTAFVEHFDGNINYQAVDVNGNNSAYRAQNFDCQNGIFTNATEHFSQDATGRQGGRFMLNATLGGTGCSYNVNDQVWHKAASNVQLFTNYTLSFSIGNQYDNLSDTTHYPAAFLRATINGTTLTPTGGVRTSLAGDLSWKKYSYTWNSGNAPNGFADIAFYNNTTSTNWNDFTLDEISLVKAKPVPLPGMALKNFSLWAKAGSLITTNTDGSLINYWTNSDVNGDNLVQTITGSLPVLKNNAADNINFNPVVSFSSATGQFMQVKNGFFGANTHTAVTAYIVAKFNNVNQSNKNILIENYLVDPAPSHFAHPGTAVTLKGNGQISWQAGTDPVNNTIYSPNNANESGKAIVWSFSKDNNNTASGNKQDIRKNGVVIATGNQTGSFTGSNQPFGTSNGGQFFDGNIAEIIYILDSAITPSKQNRIESYLALKYGTSMGTAVSPVNYTASDSTTVFWTANAAYQNDIFGIGTDSLSGLVQQKSNSANSGSGDGTGQSAKGNLVLATNTTLSDKHFLMIGNDAGSLSEHVIASGEANPVIVGSTRIIRNWTAANTGSIGAVDLSFDTTGLGNLKGQSMVSNYAIMIDNDGDGDYTTGTLSFFTATSATGNKINFSGLTLNNGAVFTVITFKLSSALPAVWLGFTAEAVNGNALLNWKTSDEVNVDNYSVEHSFNGISFSAVGSVVANNNTGVNNYHFTHNGLAPGIHYYRIRRTDKDGKYEFSDIKSVKITTTGANVQVRPNPIVGSMLALAVSVQQSSKTNIQVMDVAGKVIAHQAISLAAGNNLVNINISSVPPGIYLVQVQLSDEVVTKKFVKEHN